MEKDIVDLKNEIVATLKAEVANAVKEETRSIERAVAQVAVPRAEDGSKELRDVANALIEKRAITLSSTGTTKVVSTIFEEASAKVPLLSMVSTFYGRDAATNIPVWTASGDPALTAEGETSVSADSTAALSVTSITPKAYVSVLPISYDAMALGPANLEAKLPSLFAKAYAKVMVKGMLTGSGSSGNMTGLFTADVIPSGNQVEADTADTLAMADLVELALKCADYADDGVIIMNPAIYSAFMADETAGIDVYKESLARDKMIEGVKVVLTSYAPSAHTAGDVVAVAGNMADYAIGIASEINVEHLKKVGEALTYVQAVQYFSGKPASAANFFALVAK